MRPKLEHDNLTDILKKNNFYQLHHYRTAGWFHECGLIAYYVRYKESNYYAVRYKLEDYEARNPKELTEILTKFKNRNIIT